ncbi:MAG: hypothetical protein AB7K52_10590 [Phycisphaerales bacterium]
MKPARSTPARLIERPRAYALPLVMLLALVGGIAATMIVEHQGQQHLAEMRQIETYRAHHEQQGLAETIEMWRRYGGEPTSRRTTGSAVSDSPAPDPRRTGPRGFTLRGPAGEFYHVSMIDVQGRLLSERTLAIGLKEEAAEVLALAARFVRDAPGDPGELLRSRGPALIDVNSAPREVLAALVRAIDDRAPADGIADDLIRQRAERRLDATRLRRALTDAGLTDKDSTDLLVSLFVYESALQRIEVEARDPVRNIIARHEGLLLGDSKTSAKHPWAFLSWTRTLEFNQEQ